MAFHPAQQAGFTPQRFSETQAGGCAHNACGAVRPTRESEVASPSAPLSSQQGVPSRSLRSARRQHDGRMPELTGRNARSEWLHVRLTGEEAEHVAYLANTRGLSVSEYVRKAVLRGSGLHRLAGHRALPTDAAGTIRQLTTIAAGIRRLAAVAETSGTISQDELRACLAQVQAAIGGLTA